MGNHYLHKVMIIFAYSKANEVKIIPKGKKKKKQLGTVRLLPPRYP